ncbi:hypothetical protein [Methanolobus psychrotolerans]|uniref:hypothetical protein n=1 Tax=Methanolobus psychrotolerans TaxID=1874706 RepID=UPI000B91888E|nr:hypothetical protein [Methanolobus psychrotolerans]
MEGETDDLVAKVTDLSLEFEFEFVTPYTSLFVEIPEAEKPAETDSVHPSDMYAYETIVIGDEHYALTAGKKTVEEMMEEIPIEEAEEPAPGFEALYAVSGIVAGVWLVLKRRQE